MDVPLACTHPSLTTRSLATLTSLQRHTITTPLPPRTKPTISGLSHNTEFETSCGLNELEETPWKGILPVVWESVFGDKACSNQHCENSLLGVRLLNHRLVPPSQHLIPRRRSLL
jgi:hypothetical protein